MSVVRRALAALVASLTVGALALPAAAQAPRALSDADRLNYTTAFDALRRGQIEEARAVASRLRDRVLLGQLEFERLFHPNYVASYEELTAWLEEYGDLPPARRVYTLAMRRRPDGAEPPPPPRAHALLRAWANLTGAEDPLAATAEPPTPRAAREALNADDLQGAWTLAGQSGDWWTAGLAAWRMNRFAESLTAFERVAADPTEDIWVRAGAGVWAARAAVAAGQPERAPEFLRLAARWPATFYGQVAMAQLGEQPVIENLGPQPYYAVAARDAARARPQDVPLAELEAFIQVNESARRAVAFSELGLWSDARQTLRTGVRTAADEAERRLWAGLAESLGPRVTGPAEGAIDARDYPLPVLEPEGGFTIAPALVYAIARKESGFEPRARSAVGAYGMMQVMPATAAELAGDRGFITDPQRLWVPATNLRLGQMYIQRMLGLRAFEGDVLRAVASYNAGPGPMLAALRRLGPDADPLLLIETIDVPQARQYVEEVMAAYWIYQRLLGGPVHTLEAVASGARLAPLSLDHVEPEPALVAAAAPPAPVTP